MNEAKEYIRKDDGFRAAMTDKELSQVQNPSDWELYSAHIKRELARTDAPKEAPKAREKRTDPAEAAKAASPQVKVPDPRPEADGPLSSGQS
jgi:hypothetical protein